MALAARWIRLEQTARAAWRAACTGFTQAQPLRAAPTVFWMREASGDYAFALVVSRLLAPGRAWRWPSWALAPAIATYRQFGQRAYLDGDDICLAGRRIAAGEAAAAGEGVVVSSGFVGQLPGRPDWSERALVEAFRGRMEAQHGWQFDHSWPNADEKASIAEALTLEPAGAA